MKYGIALIPEEKEIDIFIKYQNGLKELFPNLRPTLGKNTNIPHITLFQGKFKENFDYKILLNDVIDRYYSKLKNLKLQVSDFQILNGRWFFLNVDDNKGLLQSIHEDILRKIEKNIILDNPAPNYYNLQEKKCYEKYGYRFSKDLYIPHITLGMIQDLVSQDQDEIKRFTQNFLEKEKVQNISIKNIIYHELGNNGSCKKIKFTSNSWK